MNTSWQIQLALLFPFHFDGTPKLRLLYCCMCCRMGLLAMHKYGLLYIFLNLLITIVALTLMGKVTRELISGLRCLK